MNIGAVSAGVSVTLSYESSLFGIIFTSFGSQTFTAADANSTRTFDFDPGSSNRFFRAVATHTGDGNATYGVTVSAHDNQCGSERTPACAYWADFDKDDLIVGGGGAAITGGFANEEDKTSVLQERYRFDSITNVSFSDDKAGREKAVVESIDVLAAFVQGVPMAQRSDPRPENSTLPITVRFDPLRADQSVDTLRISSNSLGGGIIEIPMTGIGVASSGDLRIDVPNNNIGGQRTDDESLFAKEFATITNSGADPLTIRLVTVVEGSDQFRVSGLPAGFGPSSPLVLNPDASFTVDLEYRLRRAGLQRGTVQIVTDDPEQPIFTFTVVGTGIEGATPEGRSGNDFVVVRSDTDGSATHLTSDTAGDFPLNLPPDTAFEYTMFDPETGLVAFDVGVTAPEGEETELLTPLFEAATGTDSDGDGLPDEIEDAIGSDPNRTDTNRDGIDDFDSILQGLDPVQPNFKALVGGGGPPASSGAAAAAGAAASTGAVAEEQAAGTEEMPLDLPAGDLAAASDPEADEPVSRPADEETATLLRRVDRRVETPQGRPHGMWDRTVRRGAHYAETELDGLVDTIAADVAVAYRSAEPIAGKIGPKPS